MVFFMNELYRLPPSYKPFYDKLMALFVQNCPMSLRSLDFKLPIYMHTPLVMLDIFVNCIHNYEIQATFTLLEWIASDSFLRYMLSNKPDELIDKITELLKKLLESAEKALQKRFRLSHFLLQTIIIQYLLPNHERNDLYAMIDAYTKVLVKQGFVPPVSFAVALAQHTYPLHPFLLTNPYYLVALHSNVHFINYLYPQIVAKSTALKKALAIQRKYDEQKIERQQERSKWEIMLKLSQNRKEVLSVLGRIVKLPQYQSSQYDRLIVIILMFEQHFGNIRDEFPDYFKGRVIDKFRTFLFLVHLGNHFLDLDKLPADSVRYLRAFASNPQFQICGFHKSKLKEIYLFMRKFCYTPANLIAFGKPNTVIWEQKAFFFSAVLLYDYMHQNIDIEIERMTTFYYNLDSQIAIKALLVFFHRGTLDKPLLRKIESALNLKAPAEIDLYEAHLLQNLIKWFQPEFAPEFESFLKHSKYPMPSAQNGLSVKCRSFDLASKNLVCVPYCRDSLTLKAYEIPSQGLVVVESTAGPEKIDFMCKSAINLIEVRSPELKIVVLDLVEWIESNEKEKSLYLQRLGLTFRS